MSIAESEDLSFRMSKLEEFVKGFLKKGDLDDLKGELMNELEKRMEGIVKTLDLFKLKKIMGQSMGNMKESMDENMQRLVMLIQNEEEKILKHIDMGQGSQENKYMVQVDKPSTTKPNTRGYVSNNGCNQAWSSRGMQLPKLNMRKFDGKDPITWIFQMEHFFYLHQVPTSQKVTIASLYLDPEQVVWYQCLCERKKGSIISWSIFTKELIAYHEDIKSNSFFTQLTHL